MKYLRVAGLHGDYDDVTYELTDSSLSTVLDEIWEHFDGGGVRSDIKMEIVELKPSEYKKMDEI